MDLMFFRELNLIKSNLQILVDLFILGAKESNTRKELTFYDTKLKCCYNVIIYNISTLSSLSNRIHSLKF